MSSVAFRHRLSYMWTSCGVLWENKEEAEELRGREGRRATVNPVEEALHPEQARRLGISAEYEEVAV